MTDWSDWSPCSASCGKGVKLRTRLLIVDPSLQAECSSRVELLQQRPCLVQSDCTFDMATAKGIKKQEILTCENKVFLWQLELLISRHSSIFVIASGIRCISFYSRVHGGGRSWSVQRLLPEVGFQPAEINVRAFRVRRMSWQPEQFPDGGRVRQHLRCCKRECFFVKSDVRAGLRCHLNSRFSGAKCSYRPSF